MKKLSDVIAELIKLHAEHGDIPVKHFDSEFMTHSDPEIEVRKYWTVPGTFEDVHETIVQVT